MTDKISKLHRSWVMSRVRGKNTRPERAARSLLHFLGYRFTVNGPRNKKLPGKPDIVLPKFKTAIFVHGCFWHRHQHCKRATTPKSNLDYWLPKFERNIRRDQENQNALEKAGWKVIVVWECELEDPDAIAARFVRELPRAAPYALPDEMEDQSLVAETRIQYGKKRK